MNKMLKDKGKSKKDMDPMYKKAKMGVLSHIADMAGKSMGEDLKGHPKQKNEPYEASRQGMSSGYKDAQDMIMRHAKADGHDPMSMAMLDRDGEEDDLHANNAQGEQDHSSHDHFGMKNMNNYAKGGDVLGHHDTPGIVHYQDNEMDDEHTPSAKGFDFGKDARNHKEDQLRNHSGYAQESSLHPEEEDGKEHEQAQAKKLGKPPHEVNDDSEADDLRDLSEEDVKAMISHLDKHLKSKWQQNK